MRVTSKGQVTILHDASRYRAYFPSFELITPKFGNNRFTTHAERSPL